METEYGTMGTEYGTMGTESFLGDQDDGGS